MTLFTDSEFTSLHRPIEHATALPNRAYVDTAWYHEEQERIFSRRWVAVCFRHQVANPGTVRPVTVAGRPVVLVTDAAAEVRAFHNVCAYDGCEVASEPATDVERLVGPYHGWQWDLEGHLVATPYFDGTPDPPVGHLSARGDLVPVAVATWLDLVFVCLAPVPPDFDEVTAPIRERLVGADLSEFEVCRAEDGRPWISSGVVPSNWKIAFENDVEILHESFVHDDYRSSPYSPKVDAEGSMTCLAVADRGLFGLAAPISEYFDPDDAPLPVIPVEGAEHIDHFHIYDLYPNVQIGVGADHFTLGFYRPDGPDASHNEVAYYVHRSCAADHTITALIAAGWDLARVEDNVVCAATQRGRRSPALAAMFYAPFWDQHVQHFHQLIAHDLTIDERSQP
jgi:choline monooxygenase